MRHDGVLFVCDLTNTAENGEMPKEELTKINKYWFEMRPISFSRAYQAKGVNEQVDIVARIPLDTSIHIGQYAMLGNGEQYRITNINHSQEEFIRTKSIDSKYYRQPIIVGLKYTDLTLSRIEDYYAVAESDTTENQDSTNGD